MVSWELPMAPRAETHVPIRAARLLAVEAGEGIALHEEIHQALAGQTGAAAGR